MYSREAPSGPVSPNIIMPRSSAGASSLDSVRNSRAATAIAAIVVPTTSHGRRISRRRSES